MKGPTFYTDGTNVGYIDSINCFRTMMAYNDEILCENCPDKQCTRIQYYSNPNYMYQAYGVYRSTGDFNHNNADWISSKGSYVTSGNMITNSTFI